VPLREPCADWALALPEADASVYGGLTQAERIRRRQAASVLTGGTGKGYPGSRHRHDHDPGGASLPANRRRHPAMSSMSWESQPEASGPVTEPAASYGAALDYQGLAQHSVRLPQLDPAAPPGSMVPLSRTTALLPPELRDRERDAAARLYERREAIERAAIAAGMSALEAAAAAGRIAAEAAETARKAAQA
jgi:hypothetical protein